MTRSAPPNTQPPASVGQYPPMPPAFLTEPTPPYGTVEQVSSMVGRLVADNPSRFTYHGTGTYLVGRPGGGELAVIDPGPDDRVHVEALLAAIGDRTVSHLLITHTHPDHSPAAAALAAATGAPTYGFGPHPEAAVAAHRERVRRALDAGEEPESEDGEGGGDLAFIPTVQVGDGDVITGDGFTFEALHTPGHISNHLCFTLEEEQTLFTGDHVMGWSTTVIPAPDGNLSDYLANLRRRLDRPEQLYRPTHGPAITDPHPWVADLLAHRVERERQIIAALAAGPRTIASLVSELYAHVDEELHRAAGGSVYAHLLDLARNGRADADPRPDPEAEWRLA